MQTAELDFYAPAVDHRQVRRDRLNQQREGMFSWRNKAATTTTSARRSRGSYTNPSACAAIATYQAGPQQVTLANSERARVAEKAEKEARERGGAIWDGAIGHAHDRRRDWQLTGFEFTKDHFRTSADPSSPHHPRQKARRKLLTLTEARRAIEADPYIPYVHDQILIGEPTQSGKHVTAIAVTTNREEACQAEADAAAYQTQQLQQQRGGQRPLDGTQTFGSSSAGQRDVDDNWHASLGGSVASRQRATQTAATMYSELMAQQASLTGTAYGSPESRNVHVPTGELAYTVRPAFLDSHAQRTYHGGRRWTASRSTATVEPLTHAHSPTANDSRDITPDADDAHALDRDITLDSEVIASHDTRHGDHVRGRAGLADGAENVADMPLAHTSAEAKSMRVYAVSMHRRTTNKDTSMVARNDPVRRGVPVLLPDSWVSPGGAQ